MLLYRAQTAKQFIEAPQVSVLCCTPYPTAAEPSSSPLPTPPCTWGPRTRFGSGKLMQPDLSTFPGVRCPRPKPQFSPGLHASPNSSGLGSCLCRLTQRRRLLESPSSLLCPSVWNTPFPLCLRDTLSNTSSQNATAFQVQPWKLLSPLCLSFIF